MLLSLKPIPHPQSQHIIRSVCYHFRVYGKAKAGMSTPPVIQLIVQSER
jgi:hypothetical protein